ncbi:hypothetical protein E2C01_053484 [Portunus trituberculatus]|uniref:Uncharacterized protein n=1 Tax=Portunus trituberculatus TaxID=210409 RepID=A0A5B7GPV4_PORTR|nr:hypothetical protein [Portunus trituberculatus]
MTKAADKCDATAKHLKGKVTEHYDSLAHSLPRLHLGSYVDVKNDGTVLFRQISQFTQLTDDSM